MTYSPEGNVQQKIDKVRLAVERQRLANLESNHANICLLATVDDLGDALRADTIEQVTASDLASTFTKEEVAR